MSKKSKKAFTTSATKWVNRPKALKSVLKTQPASKTRPNQSKSPLSKTAKQSNQAKEGKPPALKENLAKTKNLKKSKPVAKKLLNWSKSAQAGPKRTLVKKKIQKKPTQKWPTADKKTTKTALANIKSIKPPKKRQPTSLTAKKRPRILKKRLSKSLKKGVNRLNSHQRIRRPSPLAGKTGKKSVKRQPALVKSRLKLSKPKGAKFVQAAQKKYPHNKVIIPFPPHVPPKSHQTKFPCPRPNRPHKGPLKVHQFYPPPPRPLSRVPCPQAHQYHHHQPHLPHKPPSHKPAAKGET